jgi:hypothetical protein
MQGSTRGDYKDVAYVTQNKIMPGVLYPAQAPEAAAIVMASTRDDSSKMNIQVRLGLRAPEGKFINELHIPDLDGRWNAGSTERDGGTPYTAREYAQIVYEAVHR